MNGARQVLDLSRIGCSDLPAILGRDPYREGVDVWARIVHGIDVEPSAFVREAGDWGLRLEEVIAQAGLDRLGLDGPLFHPPSIAPAARAWQRYSIDRVAGVMRTLDGNRLMLAGRTAVLECKARTSWSLDAQGWGADGSADVDERVLLQVTGQLEAVRADRDSWLGTDVPELEQVDVLVLVDGQRLRHYPVPYDAELGGLLVEAAERFWRDYVLTQTPPPLAYGEGTLRELRRRYPRLAGEVPAPPGADAVARDLATVRDQRKALEDREDELHARLAELAGGATRIKGADWTWSQSDQDGSLRWGELLERLRGLAGLSKDGFEKLKNDHRGQPKRVPRLTTRKGSTT